MKKTSETWKNGYFTSFSSHILIIMFQLLSYYRFSGFSCSFCLHFSGHATLFVITSLSSNPSCFDNFFKFSIPYGFQLILSVFNIAPLVAPYFSPVLAFL